MPCPCQLTIRHRCLITVNVLWFTLCSAGVCECAFRSVTVMLLAAIPCRRTKVWGLSYLLCTLCSFSVFAFGGEGIASVA